MTLTALAAHSREAVRAVLSARGWQDEPAWAAATGLECLAVVIDAISPTEREALVRWSTHAGTDVLTGSDWALVHGPASRLAPLARPDRAPADLEGLCAAIARVLAAYAEPARTWDLGTGSVGLDDPRFIGILNVTPDSFSDGGRFQDAEAALAQAERLKAAGADVVDVGGESTRPGAGPVSAVEERARVVPVVSALVGRGLGPVSVDTRRGEVAQAAVDAGAAIVNDVSGGTFDPALLDVVAQTGVGVILMHMRGTPATMDSLASYGHVAAEVAGELAALAARAEERGIARTRIVLDPGFGFAKTAVQNFRLLDDLAAVVGLGYPVAVGPSRKRFLGHATGRPVEDRDRATAVACALAWERGARLFRVHDVAIAREALAVARATASPR
ncbi:MAG TPA: dihydropteroate synthase [Gemmatimonadales bacterium]|nr:dihydropteroate synthase [Gemmatimonadales bacterium]